MSGILFSVYQTVAPIKLHNSNTPNYEDGVKVKGAEGGICNLNRLEISPNNFFNVITRTRPVYYRNFSIGFGNISFISVF